MKRLFVAGVVIWLSATVALRMAGQWVLRPGQPLSIIMLFAISGLLLFRLPRLLFSRFAITRNHYAIGGIVLVAPGMLLDTLSAVCFPIVFSNIRPEAAGLFGGWLLFCNVVALVSAATYGSGPKPASQAHPTT